MEQVSLELSVGAAIQHCLCTRGPVAMWVLYVFATCYLVCVARWLVCVKLRVSGVYASIRRERLQMDT